MYWGLTVPASLPPPLSVREAPRVTTLDDVRDVASLETVFERADFRLSAVRDGAPVPPLVVERLPRDLAGLKQPARRKATFLRIALPLVLAVNAEILRERQAVIDARARLDAGFSLSPRTADQLTSVFAAYRVPAFDFDTLLKRVDIIPSGLAMAQSIEESGWGRSRFARDGNALFGQRIFRGRGGLIPRERRRGERFRVQSFDSLLDGVRAYALNLNRHPAYAEMRARREAMRAAGKAFDSRLLARTLVSYSERREEYVRTLLRIMASNRLSDFDDARLGASAPVRLTLDSAAAE